MKWNATGRALVVCFGLAAVFTVFSYRLVDIQIAHHDEYATLAAERLIDKVPIYARRGTILDVEGEVLATNEPVRTAVADGSLITKPDELAEILAGALDIEKGTLAAKLRTERKYVILKKEIPELLASRLEREMVDAGLRGVYFEHDTVRIYPNDNMLSHVLGFINHEHSGVEGIELLMDRYLRGHDGFRFTERDRAGREIVLYRGQERPPRNGCNVRLTINMGLQNILENELDEAVRKYHPKGAVAILMRPSTGEILALANRPDFNANEPGKAEPGAMRNRAVIDMIEPGSVFKIVTAAAALNEKLVRPDTLIFCENGRFLYGGRSLKDHHGYANLSVQEILMKSSNIGSAKLALQLGDQTLYEYVRRFGFGERTGVALPGEIAGLVHPPHRWSKISITRIPMGQEVCVTPLQMVTAMAVIANGGKLMTPQIVKDIVDDQGNVITSYDPVEVRRVISARTAAEVSAALETVVSEKGTAALARVTGFRVAGKTGTAQKAGPEGGYMPGKYIVSFVGYMPAENPQFVGIVTLDEANTPPGENYGGLVSAPIFSRIAEKAARHLNLVPQPEEPPGAIVTSRTAKD